MAEIRYVEVFEDGKLIDSEPYEVSDEQLADEQEKQVMEKADVLIDSIENLADAKRFLKRLVARLIKNGGLP